MRLELLETLSVHEDDSNVWAISWGPQLPLSIASVASDRSLCLSLITKGSGIPDNGKADKPATATTISDAHRRTIRSVRISPSGRLLATASFDGTTGLWSILKQPHDTLEDSCLATLEGHENEVKGIAWSPSGALLATCGRDKSVWIWEVIDESSTGGDPDFECIAVLQEHSQDVKCVEWHPTDEDLLASASYDDTIKLWRDDDGGDWFCADTLLGHTSTVWSLAFNGKGNKLVSVSDDKSMRLWTVEVPDTSNGTASVTTRRHPKWVQAHVLEDYHTRTIYSVSWSKYHELIASVGADNTLRIARETNGVLEHIFENSLGNTDGSELNSVAWCPIAEHAALLATSGDDGRVRIWKCQGV